MKKIFIKGLVLLAGVFLILFLGRWLFLYHDSQNQIIYVPTPGMAENGEENATATATFGAALPPGNTDIYMSGGPSADAGPSGGSFMKLSHNYAREAYSNGVARDVAQAPVLHMKTLKPQAQEETYEKIGSLTSWTRDFDGDGKNIHATLDAHRVLIQQEQNSGLKGNRLLELALGVVPDQFDAVIESLRRVGNLAAFKVTKTSKTNDYKALMTQRDSLEKNKADLMALKAQGGKMSERLDLQERIFAVEKQIGDLGLSIGQFEGTTSLCTVLMTLREMGPAPSFWVFAGSAFDWAKGLFWGAILYLLYLSLAMGVTVWAIEKCKLLPTLLRAKLSGRSGK